jgi:putative sterol carrier protein
MKMNPEAMNDESLKPGSTATPFSTFLWATVYGDISAGEARLTDDVEWHLMPYNKMMKGKEEIVTWLKAGASSQKEPVFISNWTTTEWGVSELWNIGTFTEDTVEEGKQLGWPFPGDPKSFIGRKYKVAQCYVYHFNSEGKIDLIRQYLDAGSVWASAMTEEERDKLPFLKVYSGTAAGGGAGEADNKKAQAIVAGLTPKSIFETRIPENLKANLDKLAGVNAVCQFEITGDSGGSWYVDMTVVPPKVVAGTSNKAKCTITCTDKELVGIMSGEINATMAVMTGKLKISGDMGLASKLRIIIQ